MRVISLEIIEICIISMQDENVNLSRSIFLWPLSVFLCLPHALNTDSPTVSEAGKCETQVVETRFDTALRTQNRTHIHKPTQARHLSTQSAPFNARRKHFGCVFNLSAWECSVRESGIRRLVASFRPPLLSRVCHGLYRPDQRN